MRSLSRRMSLALCRAAALAAATLALSLGCASERAPISRVQANALAKSFFVGEDLAGHGDDPEFYMRTTVVDAAAGAGAEQLFTSSDAQPMTRIRFEIAEKLLIARLTYELVENTDHKGARLTPDGQIVAAYTVEKHFDIKRDYNPTTGEEQNVVVENDTDRPWNEREFFRVDWSRNLVTDAYSLDTLSEIGIESAVKWDAVAYYVNDPASPDAPVFDPERGYFDVTNKAFASPQIIHDPDWGDFPACQLVDDFPSVSCDPSEITLRQAYLRVVDHDYEAVDWNGTRMDIFGWFTADRFGYDRRNGIVDQKWHRFATLWNLYEQSHVSPAVPCANATPIGKDPHRDEDASGTEDECESVGRGSRCDEFRGECTIPTRDRKIRTITWHVNPGFPEELFEGTAKALDAWSEAIRVALVAGRLSECRRTKESGCEAALGWPARWADDWSPKVGSASPAEVPVIFALCHNPVDPAKGDGPSCGAAGTSARLGDLRYNFLNILQEYQHQSPWGIMVDAEDPLTGEKIAGSVNEWGATLDRAASTLVDLLGLLDGEIDPETYIAGQNVADWVAANQLGGGADHGKAMSAEEHAARKGAFDPAVLTPLLAGIGKGKPGEPAALRHEARVKALGDQGRLGPGNAALTARLLALRGKPLEAALVSPDMAQAAGYDPTGPISQDAIRRASPFGRRSPAMRGVEKRAASAGQAARRSCRVQAPEPDYLLGLAKQAQKLFPLAASPDKKAIHDHQAKVLLWARQEFSRGVLAHELGHSMGLRHNFAATFDSLNYRAEYWQLRSHNGQLTADCPVGTKDGTACIAPRYRDPISQEEIDGNIDRFATTSVMDYPGDQNHDMLVAGKYDKAAMRLGYGGVVDLWGEDGLSVTGGQTKSKAYALSAFGSHPGLFGVYYFPDPDPAKGSRFIHYSQYQKEFGLISDCKPDASPDAVLGAKCAEAAMDVADYRDMVDFSSDPDYAKFSWAVTPRAVDSKGRVRRGYLFQSDEYSDIGNITTFTFDAGADAYEQARFLSSGYEERYILDAFRRGRVQFNSDGVTERIQGRYLDNIQNIAKTFAFGAVLDGDPSAPAPGFLDDGYYGPLEMGATEALDLFARILTRPEPGYYCPGDVCGGGQPSGVKPTLYAADSAPLPDKYVYDFRVALGDGRYLHNDFDYGQGYWWSDYQTQVGTYYDKIWATYYLAEGFDNFISNSKEDFTDSRYKNVSFSTVFPEQVRRLYANLLTNDADAYAPWVVVPKNPIDTPTGTLVYSRWYDLAAPAARPPGAKLVDPNYAWNEQIYAMVWGAMFFPTNHSQSWVSDARITLLASEQASWPASETIAFVNPVSAMTYRAHMAGTELVHGSTHQKGAGARMLEWANHLVTVAYLVVVDVNGDPVLNPDGTPTLVLDIDGKPQKNPASPGADAVLQKYVDTLDTLRQLTATFDPSAWGGQLPNP